MRHVSTPAEQYEVFRAGGLCGRVGAVPDEHHRGADTRDGPVLQAESIVIDHTLANVVTSFIESHATFLYPLTTVRKRYTI